MEEIMIANLPKEICNDMPVPSGIGKRLLAGLSSLVSTSTYGFRVESVECRDAESPYTDYDMIYHVVATGYANRAVTARFALSYHITGSGDVYDYAYYYVPEDDHIVVDVLGSGGTAWSRFSGTPEEYVPELAELVAGLKNRCLLNMAICGLNTVKEEIGNPPYDRGDFLSRWSAI